MRKLDYSQVDEKAREVIEIFQMWGITQEDAERIGKIIASKARDATNWKNPLKGTGLTVPGNPNWKEPDDGGQTEH